MNNARIKRPQGSGANGETAILVSRGEPSRTPEEATAHVTEQAESYLRDYTDRTISANTLRLLVELIIHDQYGPPGSPRVWLTREHLLAYLNVIENREGR